jgi:predicted ArsR family transcriptional regulator
MNLAILTLAFPHPKRRTPLYRSKSILQLLRREGPLTPAEISARLHVSPNATRQRLLRLKQAGLIRKLGNTYQVR